MQKKYSLSQQLSNVTGRRMPSKTLSLQNKFRFIRSLRPCARWSGDSIDHINISSNARTDLGRALSPSFALQFIHDAFGEKTSISNLWNDIDKFVGAKAVLNHEIELPFILLDALWLRIKQYPKLAEELKNEKLPLDMYSYNEAELPFRRALAYWWLEGVFAIREALVHGYDYPNFESIIYGEEVSRDKILESFLNTYIPNRRSVAQKREAEIVDKQAPSLVKQLRSTPPMVHGLKKFSMTIHLNDKAKTKKETKAPVEISVSVENPKEWMSEGTMKEFKELLAPDVVSNAPPPQEAVKTPMVEETKDAVLKEDKASISLNEICDLEGITFEVRVPKEPVALEVSDNKPQETLEEVIEKTRAHLLQEVPVVQEVISIVPDVSSGDPTPVLEEEQEESTDKISMESEDAPYYSEEALSSVESLLTEHAEDPAVISRVKDGLLTILKADDIFMRCASDNDFELDFTSNTHCFTVSVEGVDITVTASELDATALEVSDSQIS